MASRSTTRFSTILATLAISGGVAAAQPTDQPQPQRHSRSTALAIALGGTAVSLGVIATGVMLHSGNSGVTDGLLLGGTLGLAAAPSAAHYYADGNVLTVALGVRAAGLATMSVSGYFLARDAGAALACGLTGCSSHATSTAPAIVFLAGAAAFVGGTIYDIATAPGAADRWNAQHTPSVQVTPTLVPTASGGVTGGLGMVGQF